MSIRDGLGEYWKFDEGSGTVAHGVLKRMNLSLSLEGFTPRGAHGLVGHWNAPGTDNQFSGLGRGMFPAEWEVLEHAGDAVTIAIWHWFGGYETTLDPTTAPANPHTIDMLELHRGTGSADVFCGYSTADPPPQPPENNTHTYISYFTPDGVGHYLNAPPYENLAADQVSYCLMLECVRNVDGTVTSRLYVDGSANMDPGTYATSTGISYLDVGGYGAAGTRGAAIWLRTLTSEERGEVFDGDGPGVLDPPDVDPPGPEVLVDEGGQSIFHPKYVHRLEVGYGALATPGPHREARPAHEHVARRYALEIDWANRAECLALLAAIDAVRGGAGILQWRHPQDDPAGTQLDAPRYRVVEPLTLQRTPGGQMARVRVVLERM